MRAITSLFCFVLLLAAPNPSAHAADDLLQPLADAHQWFALRDAVKANAASPFYRGLVAAAFNDVSAGEKHLRAALRAGLDRDRMYAAHQALAEIYFRNGRYPEGILEAKQTWPLRPPSDAERQMILAMEKLPAMTVVSRRPGEAQYSTWDDDLILAPVTINEKAASFLLDTDSNMSVISVSEARRLGLQQGQDTLDVAGISESSAPGGRLAVAKTMVLGATVLRNVAFTVLRDDQYPFVEMPEGSRGVIGLPVLLALKTIRWNQDKRLELGFPSRGAIPGGAALAFDGADPVAEVEIEDHRVPVVFDSGNDQTVGWARLAAEFPELLKNATRGTDEVKGFSGDGSFESATVASIRWKVGAFRAVLQNLAVYTKSTPSKRRYYGSLGADLLRQAGEVTIDFQAMQLRLTGARR